MNKTLRSLILESFPYELRVDIELLSKRRDIINREKQDELIKLLRKYNISDIALLGSGTNRYAFRYKGYTVKISTDEDGRIDNMAEFKMSPLLQPYVTKTYEISENGTILVAEYIQPFSSYAEMIQHQDQIKAILKKLSSVYLIGDVGISGKNFSNWGIRIGLDETPVCLDYAYIFDVSSDIFTCQNCKTGMLIPTQDFTALVCQNPACGKKYSFEEIRMLISADHHKQMLGDLSESGYVLTESNTTVELNPEISTYLQVKKKKKDKKKKTEDDSEEVVLDNFVFEEDGKMFDDEMIDRYSENGLVVKAKAILPQEVEEDTNYVAFSCSMDPDDDEEDDPIIKAAIDSVDDEVDDDDFDDADEDEVPFDEDDPVEEVQSKYANEFSAEFLTHISKAISKISNKIGDDMHQRSIFEQVRGAIMKKKEFGEPFYKAVQNAVFRSLVAFCGLKECTAPNDKTPGYHRDWIIDPDTDLPEGALGTLHFIERFWHIRPINRLDIGVDIMNKYRSEFSDYQGIDEKWIPLFVDRLTSKYPITKDGARKVGRAISDVWCYDEYGYDEENDPWDEEIIGDYDYAFGASDNADIDDDVAFSTSMGSEEDDPDDPDDPEDNDDYLSAVHVEVWPEHHELKIISADAAGSVVIPIYVDFDNIQTDTYNVNVWGSEKNGSFDWLCTVVPDLIFTTKDPDKWIQRFDEPSPLKSIVLSEGYKEDDTYLMGLYVYDGIYRCFENGEMENITAADDIEKLNRIICGNFLHTDVTYRHIAVNDDSLVVSEEDAEMFYQAAVGNSEDEEPLTESEKAVLDALGFTDDAEENVTYKPIRRSDVEVEPNDAE